ncbi:OVARIAN TUMOR DOMAIN-containing deubiquitinating enzyme 6 [Coffea arabica]|uniref:OTU domain-containing protein 5-B-like n=1 Tax=Coffea arabica TaxID=13443 RepID=A0A6P6TYC8_COFAR|nr:OTU domain-containing protein 5-B-like [Coffea arabica]XP_027083360.1 OTU domain-containing protein 5-B-like [Coffea arabica]XP_027083368.1 OTU domain-containing protein 5-B-like [Coffea arabica]
MTRILVQRGSAGSSSSSNQSRPSASASAPSCSSSTPAPAQSVVANNNNNYQNPVVSAEKDDELAIEAQEKNVVDDCSDISGAFESKGVSNDDLSPTSLDSNQNEADEKTVENESLPRDDFTSTGDLLKDFGGLSVVEEEIEGLVGSSLQMVTGSTYPPPPPVPPPRPSSMNSNLRRSASGTSSAVRVGSSRRTAGWPTVSTRTSPTGSRPSSPRSHCESEGYNSADEQSPCFGSSYDDTERERQFEMDIRRDKGLEVKKMLEDGNCLFRAVADQVYGDSELHDLVRQMCIDYMERERDHFSQFITEGFTSYCKRKRRDKVYGNNVEIQALSEMYNRPIHIYSYTTEPINIFHGNYNTDTPPIRLSYHHGNHYNSLVDPRRLTVGAGLGFSSLRGTNVDKDQVKAAIKAQQDQQIDNALLAEGRFYSDLELTEKEIERMVMEASRAEYLSNNTFKQQLGHRESSTSGAEPSSSGARSSISETKKEGGRDSALPECVLSSSMQIVLSMGFSYLQAIEAYSIFGDDVDSMVYYLLETSSSSSSRRKGKATE